PQSPLPRLLLWSRPPPGSPLFPYTTLFRSLGSRLDLLLGDATGELLAEEIGVRTVGELLRHYPRSYAGFGALSSAAEPTPDTHVTIVAQVTSAELRPMKNQRGRHMLKVRLDDGRRIFHVTFFNGYKVQ